MFEPVRVRTQVRHRWDCTSFLWTKSFRFPNHLLADLCFPVTEREAKNILYSTILSERYLGMMQFRGQGDTRMAPLWHDYWACFLAKEIPRIEATSDIIT
jgi:hypothetical protein